MIFKTQDSSEIDLSTESIAAFAPHPKSKDEIWTCVYLGDHKVIIQYPYKDFAKIIHARKDWNTQSPGYFTELDKSS